MIGTATSNGQPVALTRKRSTFGRDGLNLMALKDMTEGEATSPDRFFDIANQFGFTFNWAYAAAATTAYFSSGPPPGRAPRPRPPAARRSAPASTSGAASSTEWEHPHGDAVPDGLLLNWNNQSAPGFMHGDDDPYGSVHRVELFDSSRDGSRSPNDVSVMNRAATEDARSPVWPVVSQVLHGGAAPNPLAAQVVTLLDDWVAPRRAGARRRQQRPVRRRRARRS